MRKLALCAGLIGFLSACGPALPAAAPPAGLAAVAPALAQPPAPAAALPAVPEPAAAQDGTGREPPAPAPAPAPAPPARSRNPGPGEPARFDRLPRVTGGANPYRMVIDKATNTLYLYREGALVAETRVATGKRPDLTPEGQFTVAQKEVNPGWTDPDTGRFTPGGAPENPLQSRWLGLSVPGTGGWVYGIHGTLYPESMGKHASLGCVRMLNSEVEALFDLVPGGTPVTIVAGLADKHQPPALPAAPQP